MISIIYIYIYIYIYISTTINFMAVFLLYKGGYSQLVPTLVFSILNDLAHQPYSAQTLS